MKKNNALGKANILMVLPDLSIGGVSMVVIDICNLIDKELFNVSILLLSKNTEALSLKPLNSNVSIYTMEYEFITDYSILGYYKYIFLSKEKQRNLILFKSKIEKLNPSILHFHTNPSELYLGVGISKNKKISLLYTDHLVRLKNNEYSKLAEIALKKISKYLYKHYHVISVSLAVADSIKQFNLLGKEKNNHLINNSVDTNYFLPKKTKNDMFNVVYVSRIIEHKGHFDLINAWAQLPNDKQKKLFIVGPDSLNGSLQKKISELKLTETIEIVGSSGDIRNILTEMTIAVFPSHKEGLPIALLEKMSMALPVIVSDIPELTNIIIDNEDGLVFSKGNVTDLANKIEALMLDENLRERLGENARKKVIKYFSKKNEIKEVTNVYNLLLKK